MNYKFISVVVFCLISCIGFSQDNNYRIEDLLEDEKNGEEKMIQPSLRQRNSLGVIIVPLIGLGGSYRFQPERKIGFQTSVLNGEEESYVVEASGLYTIYARSVKRMFFKSKKDVHILVFQSNYFQFNSGEKMLTTHGVGLGVEVIHWRTLSSILKAGGAVYDSFDFFNATMEFGFFYRF